MELPFNEDIINQAIEQYKKYLKLIINSPTLTFNELEKYTGKGQGIYLIFENEELIYVGMTTDIRIRLKNLITSFTKHTINKIFLALELGDILVKGTGDTFINKTTETILIKNQIITKQELKGFKRKVRERIKKLKFKFYESDYHRFGNFEHFAIAVLGPIYNS